MDVLYITELSDHCLIKFSLHCNDSLLYQIDVLTYDKIIWDNSDCSLLSDTLNSRKNELSYFRSRQIKLYEPAHI